MRLPYLLKRILARFIDWILVSIVLAILIKFNPTTFNSNASSIFDFNLTNGLYFISLPIAFVYEIISLKFFSKTIGKRIFKLNVKSVNKKLTTMQICLRSLLVNLTFVLGLIGNVYIIILFVSICVNKDKQGFHDILVKTKVIEANK